MPTRKPHTVWRKYLEPWGNHRGFVHYSRKGKILPPADPRNVMVIRDTYRLPRITETDLLFLQQYIVRGTHSAELRAAHWNLVQNLARISSAYEFLRGVGTASADDLEQMKALVIQTGEDLQTGIEESALPFFAELRQKQAGFLEDYNNAMLFFRFISQQYFRTEGIRKAIARVTAEEFPGYDYDRLSYIVSYIGAENVGASLFVDRQEFDIVFVENPNTLGLITGDQPIVNLMGTGDDTGAKEVVFYYPLSPSLSCVLAPKEYRLRSMRLSTCIVKDLNDLIAWESEQFLVAMSDKDLMSLPQKESSMRPPTGRILDFLAA